MASASARPLLSLLDLLSVVGGSSGPEPASKKASVVSPQESKVKAGFAVLTGGSSGPEPASKKASVVSPQESKVKACFPVLTQEAQALSLSDAAAAPQSPPSSGSVIGPPPTVPFLSPSLAIPPGIAVPPVLDAGLSFASPDLVRQWNQLSLDLVSAGRKGPTCAARVYAYLNQAQYNGWAAFSDKASLYLDELPEQPLLTQLLASVSTAAGQAAGLQSHLLASVQQAVMAIAAHGVFNSIGASMLEADAFIPFAARAESLKQQALQALAALPNLGSQAVSPEELLAVAESFGKQLAASINARALLDGSNQQGGYADTTGYQSVSSQFNAANPRGTLDSNWQPQSTQKGLTPQWGGVTPFAIDADALTPGSILTPYGADGQLNQAFVDELNQVLDYSMNLTPQQKAIAEYWEFGGGTGYPPGVWLGFTNDQIEARGLPLEQAVKLSFAVTQALGDAAIGAWNTKYTFSSVRPVTAIGQYYYGLDTTDWGAAMTNVHGTPIVGQAWKPYLVGTPPFPDVVSGHSTFSNAAASVLRSLLGSNLFDQSVTLADSASRYSQGGFDGNAATDGSIKLDWPTFSDAAAQAGLSRLYGGIHFNDGNWRGQIMGAQVGAAVTRKALQLFGDGDVQPVQQQFGTMTADLLTGLPSSATHGAQEIYAFAGDDLLIARGASGQNLFGGEGLDTFRLLSGAAPALIRDYVAGETIQIATALFNQQISLAQLAVQPSGMGAAFTDLNLNGTVLARLDGQWNRDQLTFSLFDSPT